MAEMCTTKSTIYNSALFRQLAARNDLSQNMVQLGYTVQAGPRAGHPVSSAKNGPQHCFRLFFIVHQMELQNGSYF